MTDKEFKRLSRAQLMDIIYQLQLEVDTLKNQNLQLEKDLADKRLRIENAGNLAQAALEISNCFQSAQNAAELYLGEIKTLREEAKAERDRILAEAKKEAETILKEAKEEAATILSEAKTSQAEQDAAIEAILEEYGHDDSEEVPDSEPDNG